jgi:hypothetical protein
VDPLAVVMHEMGHRLGYDHEAKGWMAETLPLGTRRLPHGSWLDMTNEFDREEALLDEPANAGAVDGVFAELLDEQMHGNSWSP